MQIEVHCNFIVYFFSTSRTGDKHLDSSSDSEMDMPGMMMGPNSQGSKLPHNPNASLSHNILLQQSQLGTFAYG